MSITSSTASNPQEGTTQLTHRPAPQNSGLVNLPPEVFLKILGMLSIQQFGVLNQTCRHFCFITTTHPLTFLLSEYFPNFRKTDPNQTDLEAVKEHHHFNSNVAKGVYASHTLEAHDEPVTKICLDRQRLISSSGYREIKIWDLNTNTCTATLQGHDSIVYSTAIDGQRLFTGLANKTIKIWDLNSNTCIATLQGHSDRVYSLFVEGQRLISASPDGCIKIWDLNSNTCTATVKVDWDICAVAIDGQRLFAGLADKTIKIWDLNSNTSIETLEGTNSTVYYLALMGERLFSGSGNGDIKIWDLNNNTCTATLKGHTATISKLSLGRKRLFSSSFDHTIKIWDLSANTCTATLGGFTGPVYTLALDGQKLFSGSFGTTGTIKIWDFSSPDEAVFHEIADLITSEEAAIAKDAMDRFDRMPTEAKNAIYGELYSIMAPFANDYPGCAADAFRNQNGQSSTPEQREEAIFNYLAKRS